MFDTFSLHAIFRLDKALMSVVLVDFFVKNTFFVDLWKFVVIPMQSFVNSCTSTKSITLLLYYLLYKIKVTLNYIKGIHDFQIPFEHVKILSPMNLNIKECLGEVEINYKYYINSWWRNRFDLLHTI